MGFLLTPQHCALRARRQDISATPENEITHTNHIQFLLLGYEVLTALLGLARVGLVEFVPLEHAIAGLKALRTQALDRRLDACLAPSRDVHLRALTRELLHGLIPDAAAEHRNTSSCELKGRVSSCDKLLTCPR